MSRAWPATALRLPRFQAHRGLWKPGGLQENTLQAFRAAKDAGARMVELDVQLTSDKHVVVFHDRDLRRIGGSEQKVSETTLAEMRNKAGAPSLAEVLNDKHVTELINIELKTSEAINGELEQAVAELVQVSRAETRVLFSSFNPTSLRRLSKLLSEVPRALLVSEENDKDNRLYLRKMWLRFYARPHLLHLHHKMITKERLQSWKKMGFPVVAWTVNDRDVASALFELGVDGIISDEILSL